jgi:hypothetical protein
VLSLRQRAIKLIVQDLQVDALDCDFRIERSLKPEQNKAEIKIYGLSREHRKHLAGFKGGVVVELRAGYAGEDPTQPSIGEDQTAGVADPPLLFLGKLREVTVLRDGADWTTIVTSGDGDGKDRPIRFSLGPGAGLEAAIKRVVSEMRVNAGNVLQTIKGKGFKDGLGKQFVNGVTVEGPAGKELERLLRAANIDYSVQNGEIQALERGRPLATTAIEVKAPGLVGSPEIGRDKTGQKVSARTFLNADIYPGRQVSILSENVNAHFRVESVSYIGMTYGNDWYTDFEARPLSGGVVQTDNAESVDEDLQEE